MATRKRKPSGAQHRPNHATRSTKLELKTLAFPRRRSAPIGVRRYWDGILKLEDMPAHLLDTVKRNADTPLLRLPTEIRNRIWNFACGGQLVKLPSKWRTSEKGGAVRYDGDRSLLATGDLNTICNQRPGPTRVLSAFHLPEVCRQIYSETALISYGENVFDFTFIDLHSGSSMSRLLSAQRRAITTLKPDPRYLCSLPQDAGVWSHFKPIRKFLPNVRLLIVTPLAMKAVQLYHIQFTDRTGMAGSWTQEEWRTWLQQELGRWVDESVKMAFEH